MHLNVRLETTKVLFSSMNRLFRLSYISRRLSAWLDFHVKTMDCGIWAVLRPWPNVKPIDWVPVRIRVHDPWVARRFLHNFSNSNKLLRPRLPVRSRRFATCGKIQRQCWVSACRTHPFGSSIAEHTLNVRLTKSLLRYFWKRSYMYVYIYICIYVWPKGEAVLGGVSLLSVGCDAGDQNCRMYPFGPISIIRIAERTLLGRSASSEFEIGIFGQVLSVEPTAGLKKRLQTWCQ